MKTCLPCLGLLLALLYASPVSAANQPAVEEIVKLHNAGLGDETVVAFIKSKNYLFDLTADDAIQLRDRGLTSQVLSAMLASGKTPGLPVVVPASVPAPAPQYVPQSAPQYVPPPPAPQYVPQPAPAFNTLPAAPQPNVIVPPVGGQPGYAPVASPALNPEVAYFHQELSPHGRWFLVEDNQWCWQPSVAVGNVEWRPYWDRGHWVYTDQGWYWASDYPWGWAAFHYGRWNLHPRHGWIWYPGREWSSAWVVWRNGGEYCGWAPLPHGAHYDQVNARFMFNGVAVGLNFDFGLGWQHFNFTYLREMGELNRRRFGKEFEARNVFAQTTIVNNYSVSRVTVNNVPQTHVINHGINPSSIHPTKGWSTEPVRVQEMQAPPPNRAHESYNRDSRTLDVYRPRWGGR